MWMCTGCLAGFLVCALTRRQAGLRTHASPHLQVLPCGPQGVVMLVLLLLQGLYLLCAQLCPLKYLAAQRQDVWCTYAFTCTVCSCQNSYWFITS